MSIIRRHPVGVRVRDTHGASSFGPAIEGVSFSEARDGEQQQYPDIAPESIDGSAHIVRRSLDRTLFAETIRPPVVVDTLPVLPDEEYPEGSLAFLTTDGKLYRNRAGAWTAEVDGADIAANSITAGQIAAGAIGTSQLAADAVVANVINAGGTVVIDADGIQILDGKLSVVDEAGESVLTAAGFGGSLQEFLASSLYNNRFRYGINFDIFANGQTATIPYWQAQIFYGGLGRSRGRRYPDGNGIPSILLLDTNTSTGEVLLEVTQDAGAGLNAYPVTMIGGQRYQVIAATHLVGVAGKPAELFCQFSWLGVDGVPLSGSFATLASVEHDEVLRTWHSGFVEVPEDAVAASVKVTLRHEGTVLDRASRLYFVGIQPANSYWAGAPGLGTVSTDKDVATTGELTAQRVTADDAMIAGITLDADGSGNLQVTGGEVRGSGEQWIAPSLENGWVNFGSGLGNAGYRKDAQGFVHLRGVIRSGTIGSRAFQLPAGYRPSASTRFACVSNNGFGGCAINSAGDVVPNVGSNASFSLDGITFKAEL